VLFTPFTTGDGPPCAPQAIPPERYGHFLGGTVAPPPPARPPAPNGATVTLHPAEPGRSRGVVVVVGGGGSAVAEPEIHKGPERLRWPSSLIENPYRSLKAGPKLMYAGLARWVSPAHLNRG
jgi:hypothetical protein